jgi:SAM-dependent methyltransferase
VNYRTDIWPISQTEFGSASGRALVDLLEGRSREIVSAQLPVVLNGYCAVCRRLRSLEFRGNHAAIDEARGMIHLAYSETGACQTCGNNSRRRFAVEMLGERSAETRLYLTEHKTGLGDRLGSRFPNATTSEFLGDHPPGTTIDGVRHEDLHALSFPSASIDAVLCLDVLEHVNDPVKCLEEITRILAPGGRAIVTFPFHAYAPATVRRSEVVDGEIVYLFAPEYHGNPLGGGSLVFSDFSWDFIDRIQEIPAKTTFVQYWSALTLHLGGARFGLLIDKV